MAYEDELKSVVKQAVREALLEFRHVQRLDTKRVVQEARQRVIDDDEVLTSLDAAALCGVKSSTIWKWVRDGRLSPLGGQPYRYSHAEVLRARDSGRKPRGPGPIVPSVDVAEQSAQIFAGLVEKDVQDSLRD
jgi:predicted DNA-binding transcriptional regulator AlpA